MRRSGALVLTRIVLGLLWTCIKLTSTNLVRTNLTRKSVLRVAATYSMERAFRNAPLAAHLSAASLPHASSGDMSPATISASVAWLLQTLWNKTGGPMTS